MRYAVFVCMVVMLVVVTACSGDDAGEDVVASEPTQVEEEATPEPTEEPTPAPTSSPTPPQELAWEDVVEVMEPSTVMIRADFPETAVSYEGQGAGTGIVYHEDGYILTNAHVVSGAAALTVATAGSANERSARFVGLSACDDLAVIQVDDMSGLEPAAFGTSGEQRVGTEVAVLGYPLGEMLSLDLSFSRGAISNMNESIMYFENLIQHDAAINPGNSGGPLVNQKAEVLGINSLGFDPTVASGINYAIAIDQAKPVIADLEEGNNRFWLGMNLEDNLYPDYFGTEDGLVVAAVASGSSASSVGVRAPYLLTHLQGLTVNSMEDVCRILRSHNNGDSIKVEFMNVTDTALQFLEGEVVLGEDDGGAALQVVFEQALTEGETADTATGDDSSSGSEGDQAADTLTPGIWEGVAEVTIDYWAPCGEDGAWVHDGTETWQMDMRALVDVPHEGEENPYWLEVYSEVEDEGGFWLLSSWNYENGDMFEYWDLAYDGTNISGELVNIAWEEHEVGNVVYTYLPVEPCSDEGGFEFVGLQMDFDTVVEGTIGPDGGFIQITGMTVDEYLDFWILVDLVRVQ